MNKIIFSTGLRWLWIGIIVSTLDFLSKQYIYYNMILGCTKPIIPLLNLYYTHNYGIAFSFLSEYNFWKYCFIICVPIIIILSLLLMMYYNHSKDKFINIAYSFTIGGSFGNLQDRLLNGFVIDFIDLYIGNVHYPTFNIADIFICIGMIMIMFKTSLYQK
ncbi:Lipoprotein signal peptidase [Serratia symbiotica]|nr:Lipoprotein signal peptidase [Serratia symbiotica]